VYAISLDSHSAEGCSGAFVYQGNREGTDMTLKGCVLCRYRTHGHHIQVRRLYCGGHKMNTITVKCSGHLAMRTTPLFDVASTLTVSPDFKAIDPDTAIEVVRAPATGLSRGVHSIIII